MAVSISVPRMTNGYTAEIRWRSAYLVRLSGTAKPESVAVSEAGLTSSAGSTGPLPEPALPFALDSDQPQAIVSDAADPALADSDFLADQGERPALPILSRLHARKLPQDGGGSIGQSYELRLPNRL